MRRNVSISRNITKIERLLDWEEFPSKSIGRCSFQCLTAYCVFGYTSIQVYSTLEFKSCEAPFSFKIQWKYLREIIWTSGSYCSSNGSENQSKLAKTPQSEDAPDFFFFFGQNVPILVKTSLAIRSHFITGTGRRIC